MNKISNFQSCMLNLSKILLATLEFPPDRGGVARYYGEIVKHWPGEVSILKPRFWRLWPHWLPLLWQVGRQVKKEKIEMLWVGQVLPLGYVALWLKKRKKIPYAVFTHGMDILLPQKSWWKKRWLKKIIEAADLVAANSEFTRGELIKLGVEEGRTVVVYPCPGLNSELRMTNSELRTPNYEIEKRNKVILSVGRLVKRKGFDKVIEAMPRVLKRVPEAKCVIIGAGPEVAGYRLQVTELGLDEKIYILENINDEELISWYQRSNVFVMPCRQIGADVEGFGMVFLEAASFGKPVVAGDAGGAPEAIHHGYGGFVVDSESTEELYQAMIKLLIDDNFAKRMGEYGRQWVERNFQWEREIGKLIAICKDVRQI